MMKLIFLFGFVALATANVVEDNIRCISGYNVFNNAEDLVLYESKIEFRLCPAVSTSCNLYRFDGTGPDGTAFLVGGICGSDKPLTCGDIMNNLPEGQTASNCSVDTCEPGDECEGLYASYFEYATPLRCIQGTAAFIEGVAVFDNATVADCPTGADRCLNVRSTYTDADGSVIEAATGLCGYPQFNTEEQVCGAFQFYAQPDQTLDNCTLLNCTVATCGFAIYETCPVGFPGYPDVQVLPGCTVTTAVGGIFRCLGSLMEGYPYNNGTVCKANVGDTVNCLIRNLESCATGSCLSLLAQFVPDLLSQLQNFRDIPMNTSLGDILSQIPGVTANISEIIDAAICPTPGEVPAAVRRFLDMVENYPNILSINICDPTLVGDIIGFAAQFIEDFYSADEHTDVCVAWGAVKSRIFSNIEQRCSVEGVTEFFNYVLPHQRHVVPDIVTSLLLTMNIVKSTEIPGCEGVQVCANGTVSSGRVNGPNYNNVPVDFVNCGEGTQCVLINASNTVDGDKGYFQTSICAGVNATVTCDDVALSPLVEDLGDCEISHCNISSYCPSPVAYGTDVCPIADNDLQVLPSCSLRAVLGGVTSCEAGLLAGYPYSDQQTCRTNLDATVLCLAQGAANCTSGNCQTVFDAIPGARQLIQHIGSLFGQVESLEDIFEYLGANQSDRNVIYSFACPQGGEIPPLFEALVSSIPEFNLGAPMCDNNILDDLIQLGVRTARRFFLAQDKSAICEAVKSAQYHVLEWMQRRCNRESMEGAITEELPAEFQGFPAIIQQALEILEDFGKNYTFPGCEETRVCPQGSRSILQSTGMNVFDNSSYSLCPSASDECAYVTFESNQGGVSVLSETGLCAPPRFNCDDVRDFTGIDFTNCEVNFCSDNFCPRFQYAPSRASMCQVGEGDLQILPGCTFKETLNKTFNCLGDLVAGYPYNDAGVCRANLDETVRCLVAVVPNCLSGECGSILSAIPGFKNITDAIGFGAAFPIDGVEDILSLLSIIPIDTNNIRTQIYEFACPAPGSIPPLLAHIFDNLDLDDLQLPDISICRDGFVRNLASIGIDFVRNYYQAQTKQEFCQAFSTMKMQIAAEINGCDLNRLEEALYQVLPLEAYMFVPFISKAVNVVLPFLDQLEIPGCQATTTTPCSRFYADESRCGMQKAWVCDYVNWKIDFFTVWLEEAINYKQSIGMPVDIPVVACIQGFPSNMCRTGVRMCNSDSPYVCPICWCSDHEYSDLRQIYKDWKADYVWWRQAFAEYQGAMGGAGNTCY